MLTKFATTGYHFIVHSSDGRRHMKTGRQILSIATELAAQNLSGNSSLVCLR